MATDGDDTRTTLSRRELLKRVGFASAAASVPVVLVPDTADASPGQAPPPAQTEPAREALENLTVAEAAAVEAIAARLIPSDESGPGAEEARAARFIDRALGGALAPAREAYRTGLSALDSYARTTRGGPFADLSAAEQDAILRDLEENVATGFTPNAAAFFNLVRTHTIQGTFGDPYYGGNANFVGWDLLGYPGLRLAVSADEQRLDPGLKPTRRSAYDEPMFSTRRPARARREGTAEETEAHHGD
jgi:gluconate 2-dehydrogenase gamma chain